MEPSTFSDLELDIILEGLQSLIDRLFTHHVTHSREKSILRIHGITDKIHEYRRKTREEENG